ncbi:uncharacterized protein At5g43822 [Coffea eugenioides]|uniref:Uncharacterized protein At5g43822-like isoform X1 n=1 Tax=Coffea arabica TaxID=13443 RepID=A0A6P6UJV2_COFAR|nr:uncharacterized protein At5g43822-like isoform X1 [Coffea arabica]XP_027090581.1 uncharacterized protein At5g43822-like isoform X1 [Coffea arabica]XP_027149251.1 uncharacterized protein At5g43822 [Coffea eugenioides]XP_027149253.1 uncharacterized protein At5g43822 [Coffea eugenioides]
MDSMVKKYQQKFRKVKEEMGRWEELQSRLISQFTSASAIIQRLQLLQDPKNYGALECVQGIQDAVLAKQLESLQTIMLSMNKTLEDFRGVSSSLEKVVRDGRQLVKGGSTVATAKQLQQRVGIKPSLADCLEGLRLLSEMHHSEYLLKSSVISALAKVSLTPSASDNLNALQQLLVDQPNIPREEVQGIFDIIFAEDIS